MTMQNVDSNILSNLVVHEINPSAKYAASDNWNTSGEGPNDAVAFVRGEVQLDAAVIWGANNITDSGDKKAVKALLERQGIILLESNGVVLN